MFSNKIFNLDKGAYIVTGGLGFLGKAHCHAIAAYGGTPIIADIHRKGLENIKEEIKEIYKKDILFFEGDITSKKKMNDIANMIEKDFPIKGLINNAARNPIVTSDGLKNSSRLENFSLEDWELDLKIGLTGAFICTQIFGKKCLIKQAIYCKYFF